MMLLTLQSSRDPSIHTTPFPNNLVCTGFPFINTGDLTRDITEHLLDSTKPRLLKSMEKLKFCSGEEVMIFHLLVLSLMTKDIPDLHLSTKIYQLMLFHALSL